MTSRTERAHPPFGRQVIENDDIEAKVKVLQGDMVVVPNSTFAATANEAASRGFAWPGSVFQAYNTDDQLAGAEAYHEKMFPLPQFPSFSDDDGKYVDQILHDFVQNALRGLERDRI